MKYKVIATQEQLKEFYLHLSFKNGDIVDLVPNNGSIGSLLDIKSNLKFPSDFVTAFENRDFLRDFVSLNQIKTTLVSKQLGKSKGWLTQVMNRTDRGDLSDSELQSIMKQLHVDWTNTQYVNVKATKTHSAYRTRPCVYEHAKHKELLQRAFWDGRFTTA
jgi:hypothetical protein